MRPLIAAAVFVFAASVAAQPSRPPHEQRARDILEQLVEIDTTDSAGNTTTAANAIAVRLRAAGFPASDLRVLGPDPRKGNLVARYRGTGARRPLLLLAHLDVVEARREDWSLDPFTFVEQNGFFTVAVADCGSALLACPAASRVATQVVRSIAL